MDDKELYEKMYYRLYGKAANLAQQLDALITMLEATKEQLEAALLETEEMFVSHPEQEE